MIDKSDNLNPRDVAGVDEAGRGPLAGPVVAAAVILDPQVRIDGLADSKTLTAKRRESLAEQIREHAAAWCIAEASVEEIDSINILQASMLAMQRAIAGLAVTPSMALIDGNRCPVLAIPSQALVKGDQRVAEISAASILAKVERDRQMVALHQEYPVFGFDRHKGYPTRAHFAALDAHGVLPVHRRSFAPVRDRVDGAVESGITSPGRASAAARPVRRRQRRLL